MTQQLVWNEDIVQTDVCVSDEAKQQQVRNKSILEVTLVAFPHQEVVLVSQVYQHSIHSWVVHR